MGGTGSGRWGGRPTVESAHTLNINAMLKSGVIRRGCDSSSSTSWRNSYTGELTCEVAIVARMADAERANLRLVHRDGDRNICDYRIWITRTEQPFGGDRMWFVCPVTGRRVATLHLPKGGNCFASRRAWRLGYHSQRSSAKDRACNRMHKLRRRLGGDPGQPFKAIEKPHRMRWATFDRRLAQLAAAETMANDFLWPIVAALIKRTARVDRKSTAQA